MIVKLHNKEPEMSSYNTVRSDSIVSAARSLTCRDDLRFKMAATFG